MRVKSCKGRKSSEKARSLYGLGESGIINRIRRLTGDEKPGILMGIGDDAAVILSGSAKMLVSTDMMIEHVHFDLTYTTFYQLGYKLAAANISDIFAMGGRPLSFFVSMGLPDKCRPADIDEMFRGISDIAGRFGMSLSGGDTCRSRHDLILCGSIIGPVRRVISRNGARPGDSIFTTGSLGDSAAGLELLKRRKRRIRKFGAGDSMSLMKKHLMPVPAGLQNLSGITSMIDISDGLLTDLGHICDESGTGALIYRDKIPLSDALISVADGMNADPLEFAMRGGEDYVMLFTSRRRSIAGAFRIGEITKRGRYIVDRCGSRRTFGSEGYDHFR
jgi:thiamine-monophosphate kinase